MCALLGQTKAWTVKDQTVANLEPESLALVGAALTSIGAGSDFIADAWQEKLLNKYIALSEIESARLSATISHIMQECVDGVFGMTVECADKEKKDDRRRRLCYQELRHVRGRRGQEGEGRG